jgi:hypothetical protein
MGKAKRSLETIIDAPSAYPGDESGYYRETPESLLGEPDELMNTAETLRRVANNFGCSVQEVSDAMTAFFVPEQPNEKVKVDG